MLDPTPNLGPRCVILCIGCGPLVLPEYIARKLVDVPPPLLLRTARTTSQSRTVLTAIASEITAQLIDARPGEVYRPMNTQFSSSYLYSKLDDYFLNPYSHGMSSSLSPISFMATSRPKRRGPVA